MKLDITSHLLHIQQQIAALRRMYAEARRARPPFVAFVWSPA